MTWKIRHIKCQYQPADTNFSFRPLVAAYRFRLGPIRDLSASESVSTKAYGAKLVSGTSSILCIRLRYRGIPPAAEMQRVMLAANHVSWLDVYSLMRYAPLVL